MVLSGLPRNIFVAPNSHIILRSFTCLPRLFEKPLPPRLVVPENDIDESFLKGSGPGGQKINKTSSAVQLKHLPTGIVVKSQETRSRAQNRKIARRILAEKLEEIEKGDQSRTALKADKERKKKASANKKARRKYKRLEDEKEAPVAASSDGHREGSDTEQSTTEGFGTAPDTQNESSHSKG